MSSKKIANSPTQHLPTRFHKYITRNSEYLVRDGICVEVRARNSNDVRPEHAAVELRVVACVRWRRVGGHHVVVGGTPEVGDSLLLGAPENGILTTAVSRIETGASSTDAEAPPAIRIEALAS